MPKPLRIVVVLATLALACSLTAFVLLSRSPAPPDPLAPEPIVRETGLSIPEFALITQDDKPFTRGDLLGHITIVSFIFTHCPNPCPVMTSTMADLHDALAADGARDVRFLSISVDPAHDTPAALAEYGSRYDADFARWTFATAHGHPNANDTIRRIVGNGLKFAIEEDAGRPIRLDDGSTMTQIVHPSWFVLVGPKAEVLGLYRFDEPEAMKTLHQRAKAAAKLLRP